MTLASMTSGASTAIASPMFAAPFLSYSIGGASPYGIAIGDLDGDGRVDLVTSNPGAPGSVTVLLGNEDGSLGRIANYPTGNSTQSVAIADVNGDGRADVVVANYDSNTLSVLLGNGDGTLAAKTDYPTGTSP